MQQYSEATIGLRNNISTPSTREKRGTDPLDLVEPIKQNYGHAAAPLTAHGAVIIMNKNFSTGFLFVNKTSSSDVLTRSYKTEERFTILSHVQKRRRQNGREKKTEPWSSYTSCMVPTSQAESPSNVEEERQENQQDTTQDPLETPIIRSSPRLPHTYPANNGADPFHCTVVGSDAYTHSMLRYAFSHVAKKTFLAEAFSLPSVQPNGRPMRHAHIMDERLKCCVNDDMLMYSTLAYGSSCMAWSVGKYEDNKPPEYFTGKALQAMRMRLSRTNLNQTPDIWLLLSIYALTITEFWSAVPELWTKCPPRYISVLNSDKRSRLEAARIHMRALVSVVDNAGGWKDVNPYVLESSVLADKYLAIYQMTTPVIPLTWDPGRMPKARQNEFPINPNSVLPQLGKKLLQIPMCQELTDVIKDVIDFSRVAYCTWSCVDMLTALDENWLFLRNQALVYRLLSFSDSLGNVENCVRLTTLLFMLNATEYHGAYVSARTTLQYLTAALIHARLWEEGFENGILFWCLCTGAMTTERSHEKEWFQSMLIKFFKSLNSVWVKQVFREDLEAYLFLAAKQDTQLSNLIDNLSATTQALPDQLT
ncbi:hypothetical protein B7463_g11520, partial [Scytalidium lignicola]